MDEVRNVDPEIAQAIVDEQNRQNSHIELIASENWVSRAVMAAMGIIGNARATFPLPKASKEEAAELLEILRREGF